MSEYEPRLEHHKDTEPNKAELKRLSRENHERMKREAEATQTLERAHNDSIEAIQARIEKTALSSRETLEHTSLETAEHETELRASTQLKNHALNQTLKRVQKQLPVRQRVFSKIVHQPVINALSDASESTIARPSGLLVAGIFSLLSNLVVLYICRHYGYEYNFTVGLASLAAGFAVGLLVEGFLKIFRFARGKKS